MASKDDLAAHFLWQAEWCHRLGSPLYGALLERAGAEIDEFWPLFDSDSREPGENFAALRFLGAVHRIVLEGRAPELATFYPSVGGNSRSDDPWDAFVTTVREHARELSTTILNGVQTNEVGRAAALVGGFLEVARTFGLPLRILEVGTSAGLNLRWDHFRYEARGLTWGDPDSPVRLCDFNSERPLPFGVGAVVAERAGCDVAPVDPTSEDGRLTLMSYVWPDQIDRFRRLRAAIDVARRVPARVDRADVEQWLRRALAAPSPQVATVIFHSIVWTYLSESRQAKIGALIEKSGEMATDDAPLAWLRMEPDGAEASVRLRRWPGGVDREIARSGYHGAHVRWLV